MTRCTVHTNDASPCLRNTAGETKGGSLLRRAWKQSTYKGNKKKILLGKQVHCEQGKNRKPNETTNLPVIPHRTQEHTGKWFLSH